MTILTVIFAVSTLLAVVPALDCGLGSLPRKCRKDYAQPYAL